jgi:hypothetical protein
MSWTQSELQLLDPTEPRILPQDRGAWFTINWLSPSTGKLNRQRAFEADELETVLRMTAGQPNLYMSQAFFNRPMRAGAFVNYMTHSFSDLDFYRMPEFAGLSPEAVSREVRRHCDATGTPQPSAIIASGRGLYPKWFWSDPIRREGIGDVVGVNRALAKRLSRFGADSKATDAARILRITGTWHTGAQRTVELLHLEQRDGHVITYDAEALARQVAPATIQEPEADTILRPVSDLDRLARRDRTPRHFSRESWHWAIVEDCYRLAASRWNGTVPEGWRDIFGFVIACQLAPIYHPSVLSREIRAAVSLILPPDYAQRDMISHCSTLMRQAREAYQGRRWTLVYRYRKRDLIEMLEITPAEERDMRAIISDAEHPRRRQVRRADERRKAGAIERADYEARAGARRTQLVAMRERGMTWRAIGAELGVSEGEARRLGRS